MKISISLLASISVEAQRSGRSSGTYAWTYGDNGVSWPANVESCNGDRQSPIDIQTHLASLISHPKIDFAFEGYNDEITWEVINNGHAMQLNVPASSTLAVSGGALDGSYKLAQFHFHWGSADAPGSEHLIDGKRYFAEIHLVHFKEEYGDIGTALAHDDGLAVLGFFVDEVAGTADGALDRLIKNSIGTNLETPQTSLNVDESMNDLLHNFEFDDFYRYLGGLTTPTCNEVVVWTVFEKPIKINSDTRNMMAMFAEDKNNVDITLNYRAAQDLKERLVHFYSSSIEEGNLCGRCWVQDGADCVPDSSKYSLTCTSSSMMIEYDSCLFPNPSWKGSCASRNAEFVLVDGKYTSEISLDDCEISIVQENDIIKFSHELQSDVNSIGGIFTRGSSKLPLSCSYTDNFELIVPVATHLVNTQAEYNDDTLADVESSTQENGELNTLSDPNSPIYLIRRTSASTPMLGKNYKFDVQLSTPLSNMGFSVEKCRIETINDDAENKTFDFVENGCGVTLLNVATSTPWFLLGTAAEMSFNMFTIDSTVTSQQLICSVRSCFSTDGINPIVGSYCAGGVPAASTCDGYTPSRSLLTYK